MPLFFIPVHFCDRAPLCSAQISSFWVFACFSRRHFFVRIMKEGHATTAQRFRGYTFCHGVALVTQDCTLAASAVATRSAALQYGGINCCPLNEITG